MLTYVVPLRRWSIGPVDELAGYLAGLAEASALGALTAPAGLGGFAWVLRRVPRM